MSWYEKAVAAIRDIDASLPADATMDQRKKAIFDGYPFGHREYWPYKMWLKARREYLAKFGPKSDADIPPKHLSPLERMMAKAREVAP